MGARTARALAVGAGVALLAGCGGSGGGPGEAVGTDGASRTSRPSSASSADAAPPSTSASARSSRPADAGSSAGPASAPSRTATDRAVEGMGVEELAGQVIVAGYEGTSPRAAAELVEDGFGGVIVFAANVPEEVTALRETTRAVQAAQERSGRDWPAVVGVDQEGGPVQRLGEPVTQLPAGMAHGAAADPALSRELAAHSGAQLRALGVTMVLAPDADVTAGPQDPTIGIRSPGSDPAAVAETAGALAAGYREAGIVPVAKHLPGHGGVTTDSHEGLPVSDADVAALRERDLLPFTELAGQDVPVMVGHIALTALDDAPATVSAETLGALREELPADTLVVSDALNMGALDAVEEESGTDRSVAALAAGVDLLLMPPDASAARAAIVEAVEAGELPEERLREAAARVVATQQEVAEPPSEAVLREGEGLAARLAAASLTSLGPTCSPDVLDPGDAVRVVGGTRAQRQGLGEALAGQGLEVGSGGGSTVEIVAGGEYAAGRVEDGRMPGEEASGQEPSPAPSHTADVAVALDVPYGLAGSDAPVRLATFGDTPATLDHLAAALVDGVEPLGRLPVEVDGATDCSSR